MRLVLASQSATRRTMLEAAGVEFEAHPAHIDEAAVKRALTAQGQSVRGIADALAELKAIKLSQQHPDALVIGSDSMVAVDGRPFDKPASRAQAADHLRAFSGNSMSLTSAVVVAQAGRPVWRCVDEATLRVRALSDPFIERYLSKEWPAIAGCVGCFRIEGMGVLLFTSIRGDHFTILGMPLLPLLEYLRLREAIPA